MKRPLHATPYFLLLITLFLGKTLNAQISYTWNGSSSTNWNTPTNWTPNGIPGATDHVTIVTGSNTCVLSANTAISNFKLTSGTLDMGGYALTVNGTTATFTTGTVQNGSMTIPSATTTSFGNGPVTMNCLVNITSATITLRSTTFQKAVTITKTGTTNDNSYGGNVFNNVTAINNTGSGYVLLGNSSADQFNAAVTFNNTGSSNIYVAHNSTNNIFQGVTTFNNAPSTTGTIYISQNAAGTTFNDNIVVSSTSGSGIVFGGGAATSCTLAATKTITIGSGGFSAGVLLFRQFTQTGATPQSLTLTGTGNLTVGPNSAFGGDLTASSPTLFLSGCIFGGTTDLTKTGSSGDYSAGGNIFNGVSKITNSGSGFFVLGNSNPDIWNRDVTFTDNGSERLLPCWNSAGNQFNGNISVNCTASGIQFCNGNATASATLAATKTITVGAGGFSSGTLLLRQFTQTSATPQNLVLTGTSNLTFGPSSSFDGNVTASSPTLYLNGCTFNGTTDMTKTGVTGDWSSGGNIFNDVSNITNSGSSYLLLGSTNPDTWNSDVTFTDNGSERLLPCWSSAGNQFNGNIYVNTSGSATGIQFCGGNATATATLAAGKTIQPGTGGLTAGYLYLKQFTQLGNAPINLVGTGTASLYLGPNSNFGGTFAASAPDIWAQGATYNSPASFTKTGGNSNHNNQNQNIFNSTCTIDQQSNTGYFMLGYNSNDLFDDNIIVTASGKGGIYLGWTSGTGTPTMAAGKTILVGAAGFSAGFLYLNTFTQLGNAPVNLNFTGTNTGLYFARGSNIGGDMTSNTPDIYFHGCTFNGLVNATKTGSGTNYSNGNNTFQGGTTFNNAGGGAMLLGNGNPDTWNSDVSFNSSGSAYIGSGWNSAGNQFNGNISVSSTGSSVGIYFCQNAASSATLSAGNTIQVGAGGFSSGTLYLRQFTQLGSAPINLNLTGVTTLVQVGPSSAVGGDFTAVSPRILLNGAVYSGAVNVTKTGVTGEWSYGGNTFDGTTTINHLGGGYFGFANASPDIYNGDVYVNNNSTERVIFGNYSSGNQFNGNIILTQTGASQGTAFGWNAATDITQAAGKTISVGGAGFTVGYLQLMRFTQLGSAPMNLPLTGNSSLTFGPSSVIGGDLSSTSGSLFFNGCTFNGGASSTKTGATNDASSGNNIFNGPAVMTNAGSGYLLFGNGNRDQFMNAATFNNTGSNNIYVAYNSANNVFGGVSTFNNAPTANGLILVSSYSTGTVFSDNIVVTGTSGQGIQFCNASTSSTATLASGKTIGIGAAGFSSGTLLLRQFTQVGGTPQNLTLTGTAGLTFGPSSAFGGNVTSVSPSLLFNGCIFDGTVLSTKNGTSNDNSPGNNIFNGPFTVTNTGSGYFLMGNGNPDLWQSTATFNNQSSGQHMYVAYNSTGNIFNGDVTFNNQPGATGLWMYANNYGISTQFNGNITVTNVNGAGVYFGNNTGTAVLSNGKTMSVGAAGFTTGGLIFRNFTQSGTGAAQNITTTGTSFIQYGNNAAFDAAVTSSSPGLYFNNVKFNGTVNCTKTGSSSDQSQGNNIFNGVSTFINNGTGYLLMTANTPDAYNNDVAFVQNNTGLIYPNYNNNSTYAGNISVTSPAATSIVFGSGTGTATMTGSGIQNMNATGSTPAPVFTRLVIANTGGGVTLNTTSINVSKNLTLSSGLLNTTTTRILTMLNASTTAAGDALSTSYVNGPMRYQKSSSGISTLNFPIGNGADCRPVVLTINHTSGSLYSYQAQLFNISAETLGFTLPPSVDIVSRVHYYTIGRTDAAGVNQPSAQLSGNQTIQIFFGWNDYVSNGATLTIVKNVYTAPTNWIDIGGTGGPIYSAGANLSGSLTSTSSPTAFNSFSYFALADKIGGGNVLPVELLYFHARPDNGGVGLTWATTRESNNSYFTVERSKDGANFEFVQKVATAALNGNSDKHLNYTGLDSKPYNGLSYYRLKQTDIDGRDKYSEIEAVSFDQNSRLSVYPNPTRGQVFISGISSSQNTVRIEWYDAGGRLLSQETATVAGGTAILNPRFNNGIYLLKIITAEGRFTFQQVIIMK